MSNADKRLSPEGARFIAVWEGCVLHPYNDAVNNATVGIGHLIHLGPVNGNDVAHYRGFTMRGALELLQHDVGDVERQVRAAIHHELAQHQFDALVSLAYNCGPGVLESSVGRAVNAGNFHEAAARMQAWDHAGGRVLEGLRRRRQAEGRLLLEPEAAYMPPDELRWAREYDHLHGLARPKWAQRRRLAALRRAMTQRRKVIWHLAQQSGWRKLNRAHRYRELLQRTE